MKERQTRKDRQDVGHLGVGVGRLRLSPVGCVKIFCLSPQERYAYLLAVRPTGRLIAS